MAIPPLPSRRVLFIGTGGILADTDRAAALRDGLLPPTALPGLTTLVLDMTGLTPTPAALRELVLPLCERIRDGVYGDTKFVLATPDPAVTEVVELLAASHGLPLFVATSSDAGDVAAARPAGKLTEAERATLAGLRRGGGGATAAQLARWFNIEPTAAMNRLTNLTDKGYLQRYARPRRIGDVFIDPRTPLDSDNDSTEREPLRLEGEAAERAAEMLRRPRH